MAGKKVHIALPGHHDAPLRTTNSAGPKLALPKLRQHMRTWALPEARLHWHAICHVMRHTMCHCYMRRCDQPQSCDTRNAPALQRSMKWQFLDPLVPHDHTIGPMQRLHNHRIRNTRQLEVWQCHVEGDSRRGTQCYRSSKRRESRLLPSKRVSVTWAHFPAPCCMIEHSCGPIFQTPSGMFKVPECLRYR